jgi:tetratricopeptide (TPR) repeat protein
MRKILTTGIILILSISFRAEAQSLEDALRFLQQRNFVDAMDICEKLLAGSPNSASALGVRSQIHTAMGRNDLAMQDANKALSIDGKSDRALFAKAEALFYGQRDFKQALDNYDAAIKSNAYMTEAYSGKARSYMRLQNNKEALKVTNSALKKFPNDPELFFIRGQLNFQQKKFKLAVDDYDKTLSINANWNTTQVYLNRGFANDGLLKPDTALQDFAKAISADPNNASGYIARGKLLYRQSKFADAVEDFKRAEILAPENNINTYDLGMSYLRLNDKTTACRYFQRSCQQGNNEACKQRAMNCDDRRGN